MNAVPAPGTAGHRPTPERGHHTATPQAAHTTTSTTAPHPGGATHATTPATNMTGPYAEAATTYWNAGWRGVLPLPPGRKSHPPRGWTGATGAWPSYPDIAAWTEETPTGNIALRLPPGVIGIDVDAYPGKRGLQTMIETSQRWGPLVDTWRSSARDDTVSGIMLFRVPEGLRWPGELPGGDVEIIQYRHRYAVVWPSTHPDLGTPYRWYTPDDVVAVGAHVPRTDELPWLPPPWVDGLTGGQLETDAAKADLDGDQVRAWGAGVTDEPPCRRTQRIIDDTLAELAGPGSRHDTMNRGIGRLVRAADGGHYGLWVALGAVRDAFEAATGRAGTGQRDHDTARAEFARGLSGAVALVVGDPTPADQHPGGDPCTHPFAELVDHSPDRPDAPLVAPPSPAPSSSPRPVAAAATAAVLAPEPALYPARDAFEQPDGPADFTDLLDTDTDDVEPNNPGEAPQPSTRAATTDGPGRERTSWWRRDLTPVLAGRDPEPPPTVLRRDDGAALLYPGKVNGLLGASESGKTWVALAAVAEQLAGGHHVLYFDFEDTPAGIVERLRALGCSDHTISDRFDYVDPDESLKNLAAAEDWRELLAERHRSLIVVDGLNAALTQLGLDLNDNTEVTRFSTMVLKPMTRTGAAVLTIDHIPKDKEKKSDGGIGAQAKRAMMTGAAFRCEVTKPFGRGQTGKLRIIVDKDRPGKVRAVAAEAKFVGMATLSPSDDDGVHVVINAPDDKPETTSADGDFRPTHLMTAVSQFLGATPDAAYSGAQVERGVHGSNPAIRQALIRLVAEGFVERRAGPRGAVEHQHVKPYSELAELVDDDHGADDA